MVVCTCDFVLFPVLWSLTQAILKAGQITQWNPLTLQGAGLFHIAMGAVLGLAAFGRTQEKIAGANNGGANLPTSGFTTPSTPSAGGFAPAAGFGSPAPTPGASSFGGGGFGGAPTAPASGGFGSSPNSGASTFGSTAPAVVTGWGGKPAPVQPAQPEI
jgi:hypothetical protein